MTLPTIIALALTVCFFGLLALMLTAPEGWEDERGFHLGEPADHAPSHEAECLEARAADRPFHHAPEVAHD